ncbi:MAG: beta-propeller fold lactonase family protein, partial [Bacteroidota bacterium]
MQILFIGSYTEWILPDFGGTGQGIYTVGLNPETGALRVLHSVAARNPSYLTLSPDQQFLYAATELFEKDEPKVSAYKINTDYSLTLINEQPVDGGLPCHLQVWEENVLVACYESGNLLQFPLEKSGALQPASHNYSHEGSSVNPERQES